MAQRGIQEPRPQQQQLMKNEGGKKERKVEGADDKAFVLCHVVQGRWSERESSCFCLHDPSIGKGQKRGRDGGCELQSLQFGAKFVFVLRQG